MQGRKWIKKALLSEPQASFKAFPFFDSHNWEAEGQWQRGRLSLLTFFGEAKKVSGRRATPGKFHHPINLPPFTRKPFFAKPGAIVPSVFKVSPLCA